MKKEKEPKKQKPRGIYLEKKQNITYITRPRIAAMILVIAGIIGIISWIPFLMGDETLINFSLNNFGSELTEEQIKQGFMTCGLIGIALSVFSILGGILSYQSKNWKIVIVCSVLGVFILGQYLLSSILCVIATIFLILSKKDFK